jgi:hypothetical protein
LQIARFLPRYSENMPATPALSVIASHATFACPWCLT